jgi:N-acetylglucosamine kinase-like BadF-type ATPase
VSATIGVDAGQTGIRLRAEQDGGTVEAGFPGVLTDRPLMPQLADAITTFVRTNRLRPEAVGVGCSGLVTPEADDLAGLLAGTGIHRVAVAHDATTSYLGALGDRPGVVIAVGTGVVTLAVGPSAFARVDGWGHLLGDAGSGFWIGRAGMDAALRAFDGRGEPTELLERFTALFPEPAAAYVELQSDERRVSRIASFSKVVDEVAATGDPVALGIVATAGHELATSVLAGLRVVGMLAGPPPPVCALGNVLRSDRIRGAFVDRLRERWPGLELTEPAGTGLDGAELAASLPAASPLSGLVAVATR